MEKIWEEKTEICILINGDNPYVLLGASEEFPLYGKERLYKRLVLNYYPENHLINNLN